MQNPNACPWEENGSHAWPARCYSCTFCSREFRSAQALGGHMNVHRRDRARLRQCRLSNLTTTIIFPASKLNFLNPDDSIPLLGEPILGKAVTVSALGGIYLPNGNANCSLCIDKGTNGSVVEMLDLELRLWW